ncbi:MAG: Hsp33 family molecular chaperone HslO [Deltaproteobacteria bacterium]|nr:MAG: Hsp33 family molecular chaperone HslO [Deltaproteobacteria bacterium]
MRPAARPRSADPLQEAHGPEPTRGPPGGRAIGREPPARRQHLCCYDFRVVDHLLRLLVKDADLRVLGVTATGLAREAAERHRCAPSAGLVLGEALMAALLLSRLLKEPRRVMLQIECDGPIQGLMIDADAQGGVRGYPRVPQVTFPSVLGPLTEPAFGSRMQLSVLQELGEGEWYRGSIAHSGRSLARAVESYLLTSAQIESVVSLHAHPTQAGGVAAATGLIFQRLPTGNPAALEAVRARVREGFVPRWVAGALGEGRQVSVGALLDALMGGPEGKGGENLLLLERSEARFHCGCSRERMLAALCTLGDEDLREMSEAGEDAEVTCDFCRTVYRVSPSELAALRSATRGE